MGCCMGRAQPNPFQWLIGRSEDTVQYASVSFFNGRLDRAGMGREFPPAHKPEE